ncbi:MAG TPA: rhodanese-like domain-containing protein [Candidatus Methylomirabilis sp.]|nr:rhodanese-like domain-containing protein [Candidatus Methylomirabilis sp.]
MAPGTPRLTPHQAKSARDAGVLLIDLRPHAECATGYIPGSINVMFSRKSLPERVATAIPPGPPIVLLPGEDAVAEAAAEALQGADRNALQGILAGGIEAWRRAGLALVSLPQLSVADLWQRLNAPHDDLVLIDVRESFEWDLGYIEGSLLISLGEIWQRAGELDPAKEVILICEEGIRSSTAASILLHRGFTRAANVPGGFGDWFRANYPSVRPPKPPKR